MLPQKLRHICFWIFW